MDIKEDLFCKGYDPFLLEELLFELEESLIKNDDISKISNLADNTRLQLIVINELTKMLATNNNLNKFSQNVEAISFIKKAQYSWERRILKSTNSMSTELGVPLARKRPDKDQRDISNKWAELGCHISDLSKFRPVYAAKDFYEVVIALKNSNMNASKEQNYWGLINVPLKTKSFDSLKKIFYEISSGQPQVGIDYSVPSDAASNSERSRLAEKVINSCRVDLAMEFAKCGCGITQRPHLWNLILDIHLARLDTLYYEKLKRSTVEHDLLVDSLIFKDIKLTVTNDDQYFVFEDYMYQVLLPFSRDTRVLELFSSVSPCSPPRAYLRGKWNSEQHSLFYPPNGIIPFHGFAMYVAPLCYIYDDPVLLYFVFRELYMRHLHRLFVLSSHEQGIVSLCRQFEYLLQCRDPQLFLHLKSIGMQPLKPVFKWLVRAFSGFLSADQLLILWDRILGYNTLEILPVFSVAIFSFRRTNLMAVQSATAADAVLNDLLSLQVMPLLQIYLMS